MRLKTKEEIAECIAIINQTGGEAALSQRLAAVKDRIHELEKASIRVNATRINLYDRIVELEMERDIIEERLTAGTKCAHCNGIIEIPYKTVLMEGKVFCSRECVLSELTKTIEEV